MKSIANTDPVAKAKEPRRGGKPIPVVFASMYAPAGDRGRFLIITSACPYCGGRHAHYDPTPDSLTRKQAGCRSGRYLINIARVYGARSGVKVVDRAAA